MAVAASGDQMNAMPTPIAVSGNTSRQIGVVGVISIDSHVSAIASIEKPNPTIGRGWVRSTIWPTNGASTPEAIAIGAVSSADAGRRQAAHRLCVEHHRQDHRGDREADDRDADVGQAEVAVAEDRQRDQRLARVDRLPVDERGHAAPTPPTIIAQIHGAQSWDCPSCRPKTIRNMPTPDSTTPSTSKRCCWVGSAGTSQTASDQADDADRHVDEEDPLPAQAVDEHAAGQRSDQRGDPGGRAPHAHRHTAPLGREDPGDRRQRLRREQRGADTLHDPGGDQHLDRCPDSPHHSEAAVKTARPTR